MAAKKETKVDLFIYNVPGEPDDAFIGVNGKGYLLKREQWVTVPKTVEDALKNAVITTREYIEQSGGAQGAHIQKQEMIRRYPFISRPATQAGG